MTKISLTIGVIAFIFVCGISIALGVGHEQYWVLIVYRLDITMFVFYPLCLAGILLGIAGWISTKRKLAIICAVLCAFCFIALPVADGIRETIIINKAMTNPEVQLKWAQGNLERGFPSDSIEYFNNAINLAPEMIEAYIGRAEAFYLTGQFDKTIADCNKALEINPKLSDAYYFRGIASLSIAHNTNGNYGFALSDLSTAIELNPEKAYYYFQRSQLYLFTEKYDLSLTDCNKYLEYAANSTGGYFLRAEIYLRTKQYDLAANDYTKIIILDPINAIAYNDRAYCSIQRGMYEEALADANNAIEMKRNYDFVLKNDERGIAYKNRGLAYKNLGQLDKAIKDFTSAINLSDDPELLKIVNQELEEISLLQTK